MSTALWVEAILGVSILLQVTAAVLALRLIPVSRGRAAWRLVALAIFLMAVRRIIPFYELVFGPGGRRPDPWAESIALVISILMVAGIYLIRPLFEDRKRALESLRESEEKFKAIFENAMDGVVLVDAATNRFAASNAAMSRLLGCTAEEIRGLGVSDIHPAAELARVTQLYERQRRKELAVAEEVPVRRVDGTIFSADITSGPAELGDGKFVVRVFRDISERKRAEELLSQSEEKYRALFDQSVEGIYLHDLEGRILDVNQMACAQSGYSREELLRRTVFDDIADGTDNGRPPKDEIMRLWASWQPGETHTIMAEHLRKNGIAYPVEIHTRSVRYGDHRFLLATVQDITERKLSELKLRETTGLLTAFIRNSPIYSFIKEVTPTESRVLYASENFEQMVGVKASDMAGKTMAELFPLEFAAKITADDRAVVAKGVVLTVDEDLNDRCYTTIKAPITLGNKTLLVGHTIDITERKQGEAKLAETARRLELATASGGLGVWDWDITNNRMVWDDRMFQLYGIPKDAFPACVEAWLNGLHFEDKERAVAECQAAVDGVRAFDTTFRVLHPDGAVKYLKADGLVIRDQGGVAVRMLGLNKDITESKLAGEEKARLQEQLLHAQRLESVGRLAGGVAHDFNNMLGAILGHAELALRKSDPTHLLFADLEAIRKAAERSAELTRQLLSFARKQTIAPKVLDLNETVAGALAMLQPLIGENIRLEWLPKADLWPINVDPSQVEQILANLCVNARDAIAGVGKLTIETGNVTLGDDDCARHAGFVPGEYVRLVVGDDGCGMDKQTLAHLFEPFFTTKGVGKGTGLGLATVYGIVKQNSGFINVDSEPGQGTTFTIYLPRHAGKTAGNKPDGGQKPRLRGQETILLVEDEPAILNVTSEMLETLGYTVVAASTPGEALRLARTRAGEIHLLLTDVVMPEMNGRDLARNLLSLYPDLRRLFMSGYTADIIAHHGVLEEGVHFIQKPFSLSDLAARVREALEG